MTIGNRIPVDVEAWVPAPGKRAYARGRFGNGEVAYFWFPAPNGPKLDARLEDGRQNLNVPPENLLEADALPIEADELRVDEPTDEEDLLFDDDFSADDSLASSSPEQVASESGETTESEVEPAFVPLQPVPDEPEPEPEPEPLVVASAAPDDEADDVDFAEWDDEFDDDLD